MENNEIMKRLLQDDKPSTSVEKTGGAVVKANNGDTSISKIRVVTAKYKVYIVLLLIFIAILLIEYIPSTKDAYNADKNDYNQVNVQLNSIEREIRDAEQDMIYLCDESDGVISNEETLKGCLNGKSDCENLPETWKTDSGENLDYDLSIPLSYLQLHSLYNKKMPVDEKRVLRNLNEYLIKQDITGEDKKKVGEILRIEIGDPEAVEEGDEHFFQVSVDVEIKFDTVDDLIGFLYNVEKKLIDNGEDRILYKIQTVSYDIVTSDEPQITDIEMVAYYYHDEQFNDKVECNDDANADSINPEESSIEETEGNNSEDSDSIIQGIFNKLKF